MACSIERPDPQDLFDKYKAMFSATVLGGAQVIEESNEWYVTAVNYAIAEQFYAIADQAFKATDPREACCNDLYSMAADRGMYPTPALSAQGYFKLTGVAGTTIPAPLDFATDDGVEFTTASTANQPTLIDDDGHAVIRVRAITPGAAGNISETAATMNTSVADVEATVEVCGGTFCNGSDAESCDDFRARYISRLQYQPRATNTWITNKMLEWPCATRALQREGSCCRCGCEGNPLPEDCEDCGCKDCGGQLAFYVMFDNTFDCGVATTSVVEEVEEWMFGSPQGYGLGQVEIGICGRIVPVTPVMVNVAIDIADCPTSAQITQIQTQVAEFFTTLEPSKPLRSRQINSLVGNIIGYDKNYDANFTLVNSEDGYGVDSARTDDSKVYIGNCDLEPECDYILCLNELTINRSGTSQGDCP